MKWNATCGESRVLQMVLLVDFQNGVAAGAVC